MADNSRGRGRIAREKQFYNEELKLRYIEERESEVVLPNSYLESQFTYLYSHEVNNGKDISNFTTYEILEYYKLRNFTSIGSITVLNSQLSNYTQWCLQNNLVKDNQNHFLEITLDLQQGCINKLAAQKTIIDRKSFLNLIKELPNPKDQFILLSLFEFGKSKDFKTLFTARYPDIHDNVLTLFDGREVTLSNELLDIAQESYTEPNYYSITGKGSKVMPVISFNNEIITNYPNAKQDVSEFQRGRVIYGSVTRSLEYLGVGQWMSASSIVEAGKLDMIKRRSAEIGISAEIYVRTPYIKEVEKQFGCTIVKSLYVKKYADYLC